MCLGARALMSQGDRHIFTAPCPANRSQVGRHGMAKHVWCQALLESWKCHLPKAPGQLSKAFGHTSPAFRRHERDAILAVGRSRHDKKALVAVLSSDIRKHPLRLGRLATHLDFSALLSFSVDSARLLGTLGPSNVECQMCLACALKRRDRHAQIITKRGWSAPGQHQYGDRGTAVIIDVRIGQNSRSPEVITPIVSRMCFRLAPLMPIESVERCLFRCLRSRLGVPALWLGPTKPDRCMFRVRPCLYEKLDGALQL